MMRGVRILSICLSLAVVLRGAAVAADEDADSFLDESKADALPAEDAAALQEFCKKASAQWIKNNEPNLKATIAKYQETNHFTAEEQEKMQAAVPSAMEELGAAWAARLGRMLEPSVMSSTGRSIAQWKPDQFAESYAGYFQISPLGMPAWKEALRNALAPEKFAAIEAEEKADRARVIAKMQDSLGMCEDMMKQQFTRVMEARARRVTQHPEVDEERAKQVTKAAEAATKASTGQWRAEADAALAAIPVENLRLLKKSLQQQNRDPGLLLGVGGTIVQPYAQPVWKEALRTILTADERRLFSERRRINRSRRAETLAQTIIAELDPVFGFSEAQRTALVAAGSKEMMGLPDAYFEPPDPNIYYSLNLQQLLTRIQQVDAGLVEQTLEPEQVARWKSLSPDVLAPYFNYTREMPVRDAKAPPPASEAEAEQMISDVLYSQSAAVKQRERSTMEARVEVIARITKLSAEGRAVLMSAAKGAMERSAQNAFSQTEQYLRQQFQNVALKDVPARLANFSMPNFGRRGREPEWPVWTAAVERVLSDSQKQVWKEDTDARRDWRTRMMASIGVSDLEQQMKLKPEQVEKLRAKVEAIIKDYEPELENYFSAGWYLQGYYNKVPVALIPEAEIKEIFSKEEVETLTERCMPNAMNYATNLKRNHARRTNQPMPEDKDQ